jgi:hypothetical protein
MCPQEVFAKIARDFQMLCILFYYLEGLWAKLPRTVRGEDHKFFRVQTQLSTVTNLVVQATDMLLKAKSNPKNLPIDDLVRMNTDAVALVSHAIHELAQRRREIIKPHLHRD